MFSLFVYFTSIIWCLYMISYSHKYYVSNIVSGRGRTLNNRAVVIITLLLAGLPLIVLGGFRNASVGTDTAGTYYLYYYLPYSVRNASLTQKEFGFILLIKAAKAICGVDFTWMLVVICAFTTIISMVGILKSSSRCRAFYVAIIYLCFLYFESFNIMRQMCAVSIIFAALHFIEERKPLRFFCAVILAICFHNSAVVCLFILMLYFARENKVIRRVLPIVVLTIPVFLTVIFNILELIPFFEKYVKLYSDIDFDFSVTNFALIIYNMPAYALILINRNKLLHLNENNGDTVDTFNYVLIMMTLTAFSCNLFKLGMVWLARLSNYFAISQCILLPQCELFYKRRRLFRIAIVAYCFFYFILFYFVLQNSNIYPYSFA